MIAVLLSSISIFAQPRNEQEAIQIAKGFFAKSPKKKAPQLSVVSQQKVTQQIRKKVPSAKKAPAQNSSCYIINDEINQRFVIVSADERMYEILGYSDNGCFDAENAPEGLLFLLNGYDSQLEGLVSTKFEISLKAKTQYEAVSPFIQTEWGQGFPYNNLCPLDPLYGDKCVTGCVATAMAQVLKYYQYPQRGQSSISYQSSPYGIKISEDFSSYNFEWDKMPNVYDDTWTNEQKNAVAQLMYACGVSVAMHYTSAGSGAYSADVAYALINNFGYNRNLKYYDHDYFLKEEWDSIIHENLAKKQPVIYGGSGENGGHQFVLDGSDSKGLYHINWGWNGKYNEGYFELTALSTGNGDFSLGQSMVCGITPEQEEIVPTADFMTIGFVPQEWVYPLNVGSYTVCRLGKTQICGTSFHTIKHTFNGCLGIGVFDKDFKFIKSLAQQRKSMDGAHYISEMTLSYKYDKETFTEGSQYYIAPYSQEDGTDTPLLIQTKGEITDWFLIKIEDGQVKVTCKGIIEKEGEEDKDLPEGLIGTFDVKALDKSGTMKYWQTTVVKSGDDNGKYYFQNFDPAANNITVTAFMRMDGSYEIPLNNQDLGDIMLYSASSSIIVGIDKSNNTMKIGDIWGSKRLTVSDEDVEDSELSYYRRTEYVYPPDPVSVENPLINVDANSYSVNIVCATKEAHIYYTLDGATPSTSSTEYTTPIQLTENCTIKAIAVKDNNVSEIVEREIDIFKVQNPVITILESAPYTVTISSATADAKIYYTLDGTNPSDKSVLYEGPFNLTDYCTVKAIGKKNNFYDSKTESKTGGPFRGLVIENNVAGKLVDRISEAEKIDCKKLTITGHLNGTDITLIREMLINYNLMSLNIQNANIVSGGEPYYKTNYSQENTEDNVIGENMFYNCKNLAELKLPATATTIKMFAISGCDLLQELTIPCATVNSYAIRNCKNLETITLSSGVMDFKGENLDGCNKLQNIFVETSSTNYISVDGVLYDKEQAKIVKYPIGKAAKSYQIATTVKTIGEDAFSYAQFEQITIPKSTIEIEPSAFEYCRNLTSVVIPNSVKTLGYMAFWGCSKLNFVQMSTSVSELESSVFYNCINLREFTISKGIQKIASSAFENCTSLQTFNVDEENRWFASDDGILYSYNMKTLIRCPLAHYTEIFRVPDGVLNIADEAFKKCINIGMIVVPDGVLKIGSEAFSNTYITTIDMPNSINEIGSMAFWGCKNLEVFIIPENMSVIPSYMMYNCSNLKYVEIPRDIREIGSSAFQGCTSLSKIKCDIYVSDISNLNVEQSYDGTYDQFKNVPTDCLWIVPGEGKENIYNEYIEEYHKQPWFVFSWNLEDRIRDVQEPSSEMMGNIWYDLQGTRLANKPIQRGIYIYQGRKVVVK